MTIQLRKNSSPISVVVNDSEESKEIGETTFGFGQEKELFFHPHQHFTLDQKIKKRWSNQCQAQEEEEEG